MSLSTIYYFDHTSNIPDSWKLKEKVYEQADKPLLKACLLEDFENYSQFICKTDDNQALQKIKFRADQNLKLYRASLSLWDRLLNVIKRCFSFLGFEVDYDKACVVNERIQNQTCAKTTSDSDHLVEQAHQEVSQELLNKEKPIRLNNVLELLKGKNPDLIKAEGLVSKLPANSEILEQTLECLSCDEMNKKGVEFLLSKSVLPSTKALINASSIKYSTYLFKILLEAIPQADQFNMQQQILLDFPFQNRQAVINWLEKSQLTLDLEQLMSQSQLSFLEILEILKKIGDDDSLFSKRYSLQERALIQFSRNYEQNQTKINFLLKQKNYLSFDLIERILQANINTLTIISDKIPGNKKEMLERLLEEFSSFSIRPNHMKYLIELGVKPTQKAVINALKEEPEHAKILIDAVPNQAEFLSDTLKELCNTKEINDTTFRAIKWLLNTYSSQITEAEILSIAWTVKNIKLANLLADYNISIRK